MLVHMDANCKANDLLALFCLVAFSFVIILFIFSDDFNLFYLFNNGV